MTLSFAKTTKSVQIENQVIQDTNLLKLRADLYIDERSPLVKEKIRIRQNTSFLNGSAGYIVDEQNETT